MIKSNKYFKGKVQSLGFKSEGEKYTVGVMDPREYTFSTSAWEEMTVVSGQLEVQRPKSKKWTTFDAGSTFQVAANVKFKVKFTVATSYLCRYY